MNTRKLLEYRIKSHLKVLFGATCTLIPARLYRAFLSHSLSNARKYPTLPNYEEFIRRSLANKVRLTEPSQAGAETRISRSLDLGCGIAPRNPFQVRVVNGIDFASNPSEGIVGANLSIESIPFGDSLFTHVTAFDFIEHIPRVLPFKDSTRYPFIVLMNEIHRILRPGGLFFHITPAFPSKFAFTDPTHVNIITEDTFPEYFCGSYPGASAYGFTGRFNLISQAWIRDIWIATIMQKCVPLADR